MRPVIVGIIIVILVFVVGMRLSTTRSGQLTVVTTTYPYTWAVEQLKDSALHVAYLLPKGADPHSYEPSPKDIQIMRSSALVVAAGTIDTWAQKAAPSPYIASKEGNPHLWLDPLKLATVTTDVALILDEKTKSTRYSQKAESVEKELRQLDSDIATELKACKGKKAIVTHDAFEYFGKRYDINFLPVVGIDHEEEPTPRRLSELIFQIKKENIPVFTDSTMSQDIAKMISRETNVEVLYLDPLEIESNESYPTRMKKNAAILRKGLSCK